MQTCHFFLFHHYIGIDCKITALLSLLLRDSAFVLFIITVDFGDPIHRFIDFLLTSSQLLMIITLANVPNK
ncbi:hypothetical protein DMC15_03055 [Vibrio sp. 11986-1-5]|nr:hypothetical protein DMC15_03055 [Vibrio sp. 11986-1-5]